MSRERALRLFEATIEKAPEQQSAFLDEVCRGDAALRADVKALLDADERSPSFLETPAMGEGFHVAGGNRSDSTTAHDSGPSPSPAKHCGDYEIIRELGRGGMGIVYEARQRSLNRTVALKILAGSLGLTPTAVARFRREAEAAARLHHTNIVPIYATGEDNGTHYYAMELIQGQSLSEALHEMRGTRRLALPVRRRLSAVDPSPADSSRVSQSSANDFDNVARILAEVAEGLHHAHRHGVVHRDIKPSNLLLSHEGRLSISDFGLARMLEQPGMTVTGEFVGSPLYMSPEQIRVGPTPLDHRTDIYSLGATLYELLTLRPPFPGQQRDQVIAQILHNEPARPRAINGKVPFDLETICLKALEKDPGRRYQTAGEMAEDLRRYINHHAIVARRIGPIGRAAKWARRRPAVAALTACLLITIGAVGVLVHRERESTEQRAMESLDTALRSAFSGEYTEADVAIEQAEALGADRGRVHLLRGFLARQRGQFNDALIELQAAVAYHPSDVAALSVLATVWLDKGEAGHFYKFYRQVEKLPCHTFEQYLFKGFAESLMMPATAVETINEARRLRSNFSGIPLLIRARAYGYQGLNLSNPTLVAQAIQDAQAGMRNLSDSPFAVSVSLLVHVVAAAVAEQHDDDEGRRAALAQAERDARKLASYSGIAEAHKVRAFYFEFVHDFDAALQDWRAWHENGESVTASILYGIALYRRGDFNRAFEVLKEAHRHSQDPFLLVGLGFVAAELENGRRRALSFYEELKKSERYRLWLLHRLGEMDTASRVCRELRDPRNRPGDWKGGLRPMLDYNSGRITDSELLKTDLPTRAGAAYVANSERFRCVAHFEIGLKCLGQGDRIKAKEHFALANASFSLNAYQFFWSRAFLARLEQDPTWPHRQTRSPRMQNAGH